MPSQYVLDDLQISSFIVNYCFKFKNVICHRKANLAERSDYKDRLKNSGSFLGAAANFHKWPMIIGFLRCVLKAIIRELVCLSIRKNVICNNELNK